MVPINGNEKKNNEPKIQEKIYSARMHLTRFVFVSRIDNA